MTDSTDSLGVYISVPFCRAKCTYCNFASGVFSADRMDLYVDRLCAEIAAARTTPRPGAILPTHIDTIFFGGGTPSLLSPQHMHQLFATFRGEFQISPSAEITLECAPGQLNPETLDELLRQGMNRISFGVQSFNDAESGAVGRLHTRELCLAEIARLRAAGVTNINLDLIVGLPRQTAASFRESIAIAIATNVPHISVYMLEIDEDSRLGREMLASGTKYGAATTASGDDTAAWYTAACEQLNANGVQQYEISNFARISHASRHNIKYWRRQPYLGFGLDAHSMLRTSTAALRWANTDNLDTYLAEPLTPNPLALLHPTTPSLDRITPEQAFEETIFLGLRMNHGLDLAALQSEFGESLTRTAVSALREIEDAGLVRLDHNTIRLTAQGRVASNEVFSRLLIPACV